MKEVHSVMGKKKELVKQAKQEEKRRDAALSELDGSLQRLVGSREAAKSTISECQSLINSIKKTPVGFVLKCQAINAEWRKFKKTDDLIKKQYARGGISLGAAAIGTGALATIVWKLRDKLSNLIRKRNYLLLALAALLFVILWFTAFVSSLIRKKDAEELEEFIRECLHVTTDVQRKTLHANEATERTESQNASLKALAEDLEGIRGEKYSRLDSRQQKMLIEMVNGTLGLAKLLNEEADGK